MSDDIFAHPTGENNSVRCLIEVDDGFPAPAGFEPINLTGLRTEALVENINATYASSSVIGRAEDYMSYTGTQNRRYPLTASMAANDEAQARDMVRAIRTLQACCEPVRGENGFDFPPPPMIITIGTLAVARCVLESVQVTWGEVHEPGTLLPHHADLNLEFTVVRRASASGSQNNLNSFLSF